MKKFLLFATLISTTALAEKPFPESCENFISTAKEAFDIVLKEDPSKAEEIKQMQQTFADMRKEWLKIEAIEVDSLREAGEEMITEICQKGLESLEKSVEKYKTQ